MKEDKATLSVTSALKGQLHGRKTMEAIEKQIDQKIIPFKFASEKTAKPHNYDYDDQGREVAFENEEGEFRYCVYDDEGNIIAYSDSNGTLLPL